jgi:hypothetical protein
LSSETSTTGYRLGYARISTVDQDQALQHVALVAAGCQRIFVDKVSGKHAMRWAVVPDRQVISRPDDDSVIGIFGLVTCATSTASGF